MISFANKKLSLICFTAILVLTLHSEAQSSKTVNLQGFSAVAVSAGIEMYIRQGNTESAKIVASEDMINEVEIRKNGSTLSVGWKDNWSLRKMWKNKTAKVYLNYKSLNSISASSGSSLSTENILKTDQLNASISSGAKMNAAVSCKELELETSSGAAVVFKGTAINIKLESASGSSVDALALQTDYARVNTSSGANVTISVNKAIETNTSSGSNIRYKGNAALKNNTSSKSSGVSRID